MPGKTLNEVSKILSGDAEKDITIYFTSKHIVFEFDDTIVVSRLIEGEYFRIAQMLSGDYETKVRINKKEMLSCIDRATLLQAHRQNEIDIALLFILDKAGSLWIHHIEIHFLVVNYPQGVYQELGVETDGQIPALL